MRCEMIKKEPKKTKTKKTTEVAYKSYFQEIKDELKKVKWLSKEEMVKYTVAAVIFIVIFGLYFYGMDFIFSWLKGLIG
jgi:preprotein translocase subunit SecE